MDEILRVRCGVLRNTPTCERAHVCARVLIAFWGCSQNWEALARCVCKPALAVLCVLEKHGDAPQNCCLPCACLLYFSFVSWSGNHRLIPVKSCKWLPLLDQTQKNSSCWLKRIYIPQVITVWRSPLYSFPRVKAEVLVHFSFLFSPIFLFSRLPFSEEIRKPKEWSPWVLTSAAVILTDSKET